MPLYCYLQAGSPSISFIQRNAALQFVETAGYVRWDAWACLQTLKEVTKALIFLHENRILHGDLKVRQLCLFVEACRAFSSAHVARIGRRLVFPGTSRFGRSMVMIALEYP